MKNNKGFTLVEIAIIVAIILLLAAIAIPNILRARINANETNAQATLKSIATAFENYYTINNSYPNDTTALYAASPPYLSTDYFTGPHNGFTYAAILTFSTYYVDAVPVSASLGTASYTLTTGGVIQKN